ncbi:TIGR02281 family clan AA aspartic protease [Sphingomonas sp. G-3-2-10]|uniref:retropepsin-like aspartic protease family protein n=1 Tax=Sphingomonas sp. G-3-2-10 TaxID=2728838 RepID=UPI00146D5D95|nr:TIGR02281 family clan AA aspartic protease [Sphingomonas sp. G-3-2-10]NML05247.1 TIGR02281 family clan AA aspartic protease [Sphingomonas sp. G-3-2-10]
MNNQLLALIVAAVALLIAARLLAGGFTVRGLIQSLVSWAAIGLVAFIVFTHQQELGSLLARVSERLGYDQKVEGDTVRIPMSRDGHFWARVTINGVERRMLVDSGATITALSESTAREAGIDIGRGLPVVIETANGSVSARSTRARLVEVGPLRTGDLEVVVARSFGEFDVLGMNFLSRLDSWRVEGKMLVLEPARGGNDNIRGSNSAEKADMPGKRDQREP